MADSHTQHTRSAPDQTAAKAGPALPGDAFTIERVGHSRRRQLLGLLLTGQSRGGEAAADQFSTLAQSEPWVTDELWAAWHQGEPEAAAMLVPCVGRTAVVFLSPPGSPHYLPAGRALLRHLLSHLPADRYAVVQALLEPHKSLEVKAFCESGFASLAHLVYMERNSFAPFDPSISLSHSVEDDVAQQNGDLRLERYRPELYDDFLAAVERSYEDTLDCPMLLGKRPIQDVLAGHRAVGRFEPDLWWVIYDQGSPHGVTLLNPHPQRGILELVYLGLGKALRGRRLANLLMLHALQEARRRELGLMQLAVDELNTPAMKLYRRLGFRPTSRRLALIHTPTPPTPEP